MAPPLVRELEPADAAGLSRCIERCYGETYFAAEFYDPERLAELLDSGRLRSVGGVTEAGEVAGHTGLTVRHPSASVIEAGFTIVDPDYRGSGLLRGLGIALVELCRKHGFAGFMHFPTTAHEVMQKTAVRFGGVETGVMLSYAPADLDFVGVDRPSGRLAATAVYQPIGTLPPREVMLPERHAQLLEQLYAKLEAPRKLRHADPEHGDAPADSRARTVVNERQGLVHIAFELLGGEPGARAEAAIAQHPSASVIQVDLPLGDPAVGVAVEQLAALGFRYCCLLPDFADGDVLRLQRLPAGDHSALHPALANDGAKLLLAYIAR